MCNKVYYRYYYYQFVRIIIDYTYLDIQYVYLNTCTFQAYNLAPEVFLIFYLNFSTNTILIKTCQFR